MLLPLTSSLLQAEASKFAIAESHHAETTLYGVDNGKTIGTYIEQKFRNHLSARYTFGLGNSALGIDFPSLNIDVKTTSIAQPQSSCPYRSARQKIFGLGYDLLVFVYRKQEDASTRTATLSFANVVFVEAAYTGDFQTTTGLNKLLANDANEDDIVAFLHERALPIDDIEATAIATDLLGLGQIPEGYLTISNALQWRLQYQRVITRAGTVTGVHKLL